MKYGIRKDEIRSLTQRQIELFYKQSLTDKDHELARGIQAAGLGVNGGKKTQSIIEKLLNG